MRRSVVVTGAGSGIGLATALRLAEAGFAVIGAVHDAEEEGELGNEARRRRLEVDIRRAELSEQAERTRLMEGLSPWAVVNNAGYMNVGELFDVPLEDARRQIETLVVAPLHLARLALPQMIERHDGRIVNVTSSVVYAATPLVGWYRACKAALAALTDALRLEMAGCGIDVIGIEPGGIDTSIWDRASEELARRRPTAWRTSTYDRAEQVLEATRGVMGNPSDVAGAVLNALTVGRPKARYRVGASATALHVAEEVLPEFLRDRVAELLVGTRP